MGEENPFVLETVHKILRENEERSVEDCLRALAILSGRFTMSPSEMSSVTSAYKRLLSTLSKKPFDCLSIEQWASLIDSLCKNQVITSTVWELNKEDSDRLGTPEIDESERQKNLIRRIRSFLIEFDIVRNLIFACWNGFDSDTYLHVLTKNKHLPEPNGEDVTKAKVILQLFSLDWMDVPMDTVLLTKVAIASLAFMRSTMGNESLESVTLFDTAAVIHEKAIHYYFATSEMSPENDEFLKTITKGYDDILNESEDTDNNSDQFLKVLDIFLATLPWLPRGEKDDLCDEGTMWDCIGRMTEIVDQELDVKSKAMETESLDSPEENTFAQDIGAGVVQICESVSKDLDQQLAEEKARTERISKLRERISTLLYNVSSKSTLVDNDKITSILHKLCELSATCFSEYPELSFSFECAVRNGAISKTVQENIVDDCLKLGHFQSEWVVKNVVSSATPTMGNALAEKIIRFFVSQIKSKHLDGEKHSFSPEDLEICRSARCVMTQEGSPLFKEILTYFNQLCSQKRMAEDPLIDQIMSMMHIMFTAGCFLENMADTETTDSYFDLVKAIVPLSSTGCSQSELSSASRHFAAWSLNQSNFLCLPYVFPVFTEKELEETTDFVVLSYMFRLTPFYRSSHGTELINAMYGNDIVRKIDEYFSPKNTEALFARILGIFSEHIRSKIGKPSTVEAHYILAFYDCLLVAFSSTEMQLSVSTMESLRKMLKNLDLYDLSSTTSVRFGNMLGLERLSSLFNIYRNHMLNECMSFQKMVDDCVDDVVLDMMHHDKKKVISPAYPSNEYRLSSDKLDFVLDGEKLTMVESIIECIRAEVAAYIFGLFKNDTNISNMCDGLRDEVAKFLIEVSSSAQYSVMDAESANTFLNMVVPDNYALHHVFLLNTILSVATNTEPQDTFEKYPLSQFLGDVLSELFSSEIYAKRWTKNPPMDPLEEYLAKCADTTDFSFALNPNLVSALSSIFCNSKTDPSIKNGIAQTVLSNIHSLSDWVRGSHFPAVVLSGFKGIFRYLEGNSDVVDKIKRAVSECVELVIRPAVVQELAEFVQIEVQSTDRFAQACLKSRPAKEPKALSHMRNIGKRPAVTDIFTDTLKMLCTYGDSDTHLKIVKTISEVLGELCGLSSEEEKVVRGETMLQNPSDNQLLFRTSVANALLKYCVELYKQLGEEEQDGYYSDSEGVKNVINRKGGATALPSVLRKTEGGQRKGGKLCTYTTTETHFVQQHWYNCYTCGMTENVGMCSICAVNCHRTHDVVYCKFGSFFCDCGAKNCESMRSTANTPSANNAARGRKIIIENSKCDDPVETLLYSFPKNIGDFSETIFSHLNKIQKEMEKHVPEIDNAVRASVDAHMNMWTMESKRDLVLESLKDGVKIVTDQAVMDILEQYTKSLNGITIAKRPADQQHMERLKPRDICGVIKLGASRQLWLMLDGTTLTIHHISHGENIVDELTSARQDTETIPFAARRISCCDNKAVILGRSEILLLRFGRDGEITERTPLSMGEIPTHTNPMIKAVWAPKRPATVAIATTQYVRIFDITLDTAQHLEDLVLPVGNVQDLLLVDDDGNLCVLVLSNAGHLYRHVVTTALPTSSSYFLTNTLDCPTPQAGPPISIHYSPVSHFFFLSYETAVWFAVVKDGNFRIDSLRLEWKKLPCDHALNCWQESSGIIAAMNTQGGHNITYFYPTNKQLLMQKLDHCKRTPYAHLLYTSPSNTTVQGLMFFYDSPHIVPLTAHWASLPDLWIDGLPQEFSLRTDSMKEDTSEELPLEDLVTMMEVCEPLERVEVTSEDVQRFYDNQDMTHRLHTVSQYQLTLMQLNHFTLRYKLTDQGYIPRAIRIEVPGQKGPWKVEIGSRQVKLTSSLPRFFDVVLTRAESLKLETGELPLKFIARDNYIVLTSVRLFGIRRRDFGFPSPQVAAKSPLSLPDAHIVSLLNLFRVLAQNQLFVSKKDWLVSMGQQLTSFRSTHREVATAANHLLRVLFEKDLIGYYTTKDDIFFDDLMALISSNSPLPEVIINTLALQMKLVLCTRCTPFLNRLTAVENGPVKLISYLINQIIQQIPEESIPLVELLCASTFVFLSNLENTDEIADLFLSLFTDPKAAHVTHLVRLVAQSLIYSFSLTTRTDRQKLSSTSAKILKHGGLRPYFNESKILTDEEDISLVDKMLGPMVSADLVKNTDMFDLEAKFLVHLLKKVLIKLRDEGTMSTVSAFTKNEAVPTLSLLIFAIVLLAQLYPEKMLPTLTELIGMIDWKNPSTEKTENTYRQFLLVRLVSVFLAKCGDHVENKKKELKEKKEAKAKSREGSSDEPLPVEHSRESSADVVQVVEEVIPPQPAPTEKPKRRSIERLLDDVVTRLNTAQVLPFCLTVLQSVVTHWKGPMPDVHHSTKKAWARDNRTANVADINALKVDGSKGEIDDQFHAMVTDVVLRLPLQMKKINKSLEFSKEWTDVLCEMVLLPHAQSVRHQAKKLLICLCGNKTEFQAIRDHYLMKDQMRLLREKFKDSNEGLSHQELTEIVEIINALSKTATERPLMWHVICEEQLTWMLDMASRIADPVTTNVLELLVAAIRVEAPMENIHIADSIIAVEENKMFLKKLLMRFLVGRDEGRRWLAHGLLRSTMQLASRANQLTLIRIMWFELWPMARGNGVNGAQLADLLATYLPRVLSSQELMNVCENELTAIQKTADRIVAEGHDRTYEMFTGLGLGWGFMLMVSNPCLNCFTKKRVNEIMKLSSIKQDTRFSSNAMLVKLAGFYEVSKLIVKLSEVKRAKMVKKIKVSYCPKAVDSPVDLKTKPELWQSAGSSTVPNGEGEMVVSLSVPIVTSSLIIQFTELSESRQNNELHCPRCSSVVQPNPGVCENCGENAFQCFKCRSINYDDKDPFLCQNCGFCKYARIDVSVECRPLPRVQPITSDADRAAAIDHMSQLLVDVEQFRSQMHMGRSMCESLWLRSRPLPPQDIRSEGDNSAMMTVGGMPNIPTNEHPVYCVKELIKYCSVAHEELCSHTQQLLAYREELRQYDRTLAPDVGTLCNGFYNTSGSCFGCLCAGIRHSVAILQGICDDAGCTTKILGNDETYKNLAALGQKYLPLNGDVEAFVCRLAFENQQGAERLCELVEEGVIPGTVLCKSIMTHQDSLWQMKLRALFKIAIARSDEDTIVNTLQLIDQLLTDGRAIRKRAYRKFHDVDSDPSDDVPMQRKVRITNRNVDNRKALANWMKSNEKWEECTESGVLDDIIQDIDSWLWDCLFSRWSLVRSAAAKVLLNLSKHPGYLGTVVRIVLRGVSIAAEKSPLVAEQFFSVVNTILNKRQQLRLNFYLHGLHIWLLNFIHEECKRLYEEEHEGGIIDHNNGIVLRNFIELLVSLLCGSASEGILLKAAVDHMLLPLLQATIYLKRLLLHRTRSIDICRQALELLLRKVSSKEPLLLMHATVRTLSQDLDQYTQAQVVSVIMEVLAPERHKDEGFLIQIEKDPAQEDFLQGRMTGNPYKSTDAGLGPLMRDIKNKVCRDTEMIALLEDDNGMELLVNNQIISLSLPVAAVYDKLWHRDHPGQPLTIVYRMRGLMGDAVEPFVSSLGDKEENSAEDSVLSSLVDHFEACGGIAKILEIVENCDVSTSGRILLTHSLGLLERCAKSEKGRIALVKAGVVRVFTKILRRCVESEHDGVLAIGSDCLKQLGSLVTDVRTHEHLHHITADDARWLSNLALKKYGFDLRGDLSAEVARLLGSLVLGDDGAEEVLVDCCRETFRWCIIDTTTDVNRRSVIVQDAETLCEVVAGILPSKSGLHLKNKIVSSGVVEEACNYLLNSHPPLYSATESQEWKSFLMRPSLRLMLTFMQSMAKGHIDSQNALSEQSLPVLHRLEQVASDNSIGTLAENVMEALKENEQVAKKIEAVRLETRQKKRQMAMAMRNKQLSKMGMQVGKQGEVKIAARKIANEPHLEEVADPLAACCICREPLLRGERAAAVYAFASIFSIGDASILGSVSQMVMVHIDCHMAAIRRSGGGRNTDEWTKAALHNAGARCNILTPVVAGDPNDTPFQAALARFQTDLDVITTTPAVTRALIFKDMCQLIDRFINYQSFSDKSQGGGRESNAQYLGVLHLLACALPAGELSTLLPQWRLYSFLMTEQTAATWNEQRLDILRAALNDSANTGRHTWDELKLTCLAWSFVDGYFRQVIPIDDPDRVLWLRENLLTTLKKTTSFVQNFDIVAASKDFETFASAVDVPAADFSECFH